jgi:hypothetical protein
LRPSVLIIRFVAISSPAIHKFYDEFIPSGLSAAFDHEPFGSELRVELLRAEWVVESGPKKYR